MCLLCIEIAKGTMTPIEIARAYREQDMEGDHFADVMVTIAQNSNLEEVSKELRKLYNDEE